MRTVILALALAVIAPVHVRLGPVTPPVGMLVAVAELLAGVGVTWLAIRIVRRSCSRSFPRLMRSTS
jgi:hypothetical protein